MTRDEALAVLNTLHADYIRFGVKSLALFGSVARDEARSDSDVDILVEFEGSPSFAQYMDFKFLLEDTLGRPVDLATRNMLRPQLRTNIEKEAIRVA